MPEDQQDPQQDEQTPLVDGLVALAPETQQRAAEHQAFMAEVFAELAKINRLRREGEPVYAIPNEADQTALLNALVTLLTEKGLVTIEELLVAKIIAMEQVATDVLEQARAIHKAAIAQGLHLPQNYGQNGQA